MNFCSGKFRTCYMLRLINGGMSVKAGTVRENQGVMVQ
jgi:hypothetical protein